MSGELPKSGGLFLEKQAQKLVQYSGEICYALQLQHTNVSRGRRPCLGGGGVSFNQQCK